MRSLRRSFSWVGSLVAGLALFLGLLAAPACAALVSEEEVAREAEKAFQQMRARIPISRDLAARDYVACIAGSIIAQLEEPYRSLDWEIELFDQKSANAFAMPGGKIGVFTGIFDVAKSQDSLAAVIGHEIAHVTAQHSLKRARKKIRNNLLAAAAAGVLGGGRGTANALGLGAEVGLGLPFDRKQEKAADLEGLRLMARAGFDPRASIGLWKNMAKQNQASPPAFLSTHPATEGRIDGLISELASSLVLYNEAHQLGRLPVCE
ncbi:MAG: M48 family metallopeptidase [Acidobacteriota bacterium]